jgi:exodeoxyribonuclease-3
MKIITFNINGIRARIHQLEAIMALHDPDVIALQETKVHDDQFPIADIESIGLKPYYFGQKGHYGVAYLSKTELKNPLYGLGDDEDQQRRLISATWDNDGQADPIHIINGYFPQGESRKHETKFPMKRDFYANLLSKIQTEFQPTDNLLVMGDFNVAYQDIDIGIGEKNAKRWLGTGKCSFLPEEREWYQKILDWGLYDSYRVTHPESDKLSWFDYRSRGFEQDPKHGLRIDTILATQNLMGKIKDVDICHTIRAMEKPSDHCPVWLTVD